MLPPSSSGLTSGWCFHCWNATQGIDETAAVGARVGRPAEAVHDLARRRAPGRNLPQFLDADRIALRIAVRVELEALDQHLGQAAAGAFGQHGDLRLDVDALRVIGFVRAVLEI